MRAQARGVAQMPLDRIAQRAGSKSARASHYSREHTSWSSKPSSSGMFSETTLSLGRDLWCEVPEAPTFSALKPL